MDQQETEHDNETITLIRRLQEGDEKAREKLFENYHNYIIKIARKYSRDKEDITKTDWYSIALIAFNEAATSFKEDGGASFPSFAAQVISRRLIDLSRNNTKYSPEISVGDAFLDSFINDYDYSDLENEMSEDITWFEKKLKEFNISLEDLVLETPKHKDARCKAIDMARQIVENPEHLEKLRKRKTLPFTFLLLKFRCNPKTIQRHRKYIIAVCIALTAPRPYLKDYVLRVAKGCDENI